MVEYYQTHEPRYDLLTGELINFKNKDYYFSNDFNNKISMKKWLKEQTPDAQKDYLKKLLSQRKEKHNLIYAPTEVELRSITSPPIPYYHSLFSDYYKLCGEIGFRKKYEYPKEELKCVINTRLSDVLQNTPNSTKESILEAIDTINKIAGTNWSNYTISEQNRIGDHIWYISDLTKFKVHYPDWNITISLEETIKQMVEFEKSKING